MTTDDPVVFNDWHPVAASATLAPGSIAPVRLAGHEMALWRAWDGGVHAWEDRCPHRGTRLSIGRIEAEGLRCAYHGWCFGASGRCVEVPAQPRDPIPRGAQATVYRAAERYGLIWVCIGSSDSDRALDVPPFPEYDDPHLRTVLCGPYEVGTCGPRIVENFLDMGHFAYIHNGILGDLDHTEVCDYIVERIDPGEGIGVLLATRCFAWQSKPNSLAEQGSNVEYTYRVVRPLTAILTKLPHEQHGFREAISLHVQPLTEETSRVWIILAMTNFEQSDDELREFQDRIFLQDRPILENQTPKRLPLRGEVSVACDQMSLAYRRYLREIGLQFGVIAN